MSRGSGHRHPDTPSHRQPDQRAPPHRCDKTRSSAHTNPRRGSGGRGCASYPHRRVPVNLQVSRRGLRRCHSQYRRSDLRGSPERNLRRGVCLVPLFVRPRSVFHRHRYQIARRFFRRVPGRVPYRRRTWAFPRVRRHFFER